MIYAKKWYIIINLVFSSQTKAERLSMDAAVNSISTPFTVSHNLLFSSTPICTLATVRRYAKEKQKKEVTILFFHVASQLLLKSNISCRAINLQKLFCLYCNYISRELQKAKRVCKNCINLLRSSDSKKSLLSSLGSFSCCGILKMSLNCRCVSFLPLRTSSSWIMSDNCRMCIWHAHKPKEWANKKMNFSFSPLTNGVTKRWGAKPQPFWAFMNIDDENQCRQEKNDT